MSRPDTKSRPRLGRGLSSLLSITEPIVETETPAPADTPAVAAPATSVTHAVSVPAPTPLADDLSQFDPSGGVVADRSADVTRRIPLASIAPNPHQPRRQMDEPSLAQLADSIKSTGLIQPVIVRQLADGYQLIAGERRLRAAKLAGLADIPAIVRQVDSATQAQMALVENIQRQDLNPIDRAQAYRTMMDQLGLTQAELSARLGEDRSSVANYLRLLDLPEPVRAMIRDGRLSVGHAKLLAGVSDMLEQQRLAELVVGQGLSVRNLERLIQQGAASAHIRKPSAPSPHIQDLEKTISRQLGMRVQLRASGKKGRGRLTIHYASLDEFDTLLARLDVRTD